jgi:diacylglycerol kinase (ATP)
MTGRSTGELALVVNPAAGRGSALRWHDAVMRQLRAAGHPVRVINETGASETSAAVATAIADGVTGIAALGGDGLAHLLLQQVAGTGLPLGLIPAGTGNDLAAGLGVPEDPVAAAAAIGRGRTRAVDAGRCGDRWWASILCTGFDSEVNERANAMRWPHGPRRYDVAVLAELAALRPRPVRISVEGVTEDTEIILVAVGNTARYGGGLHMCPTARPDDGVFDVTIVGPVSRRVLVRMLPKVRHGTHLGHPAVRIERVREFGIAMSDGSTEDADNATLSAYADNATLSAYADGERIGPLPMTATCVPGALTVYVP